MNKYYSLKDFALISIVLAVGLFVLFFLYEWNEKRVQESVGVIEQVQKIDVKFGKKTEQKADAKKHESQRQAVEHCVLLQDFAYGSSRDALLHNKNFTLDNVKNSASPNPSAVYGDFYISNVRVASEITFVGDALFSVSGKFDPAHYEAVKRFFYKQYGAPSSEADCEILEFSGRCNSVIWKSGGLLVMLSQMTAGMNKYNFTVRPNKNEKSEFFVPATEEDGPPACIHEVETSAAD